MRTRRRRRSAALALCAAIGLVLLVPASGTTASAPDLSSELRELVSLPSGPPGVIAVIQRLGRTAVYTAGAGNLQTGATLKASEHMRLASASKAFSGAVALTLVNRHVLSLSDTIGRWLPQLPRAWRRVTLRQALNHTSGLVDYSASPAFQKYVVAHLHGTPSPLRLLHFVWGEKLKFRPGSRFAYSNTDNAIVALMAQAATHTRYERLLARLVYQPLHLTATSLPRGAGMPSPYIHGYDVDPPQSPGDVTTLISAAYAWASGGLVSTPLDLNRFIRGYVGARLFSRRVQRQQLRLVRGSSEPTGPGQNFAGLGIFRYRTRCGTVYGHTGNTVGYTQFMAATLDGRRSVIVSINSQLQQHGSGDKLTAFNRLRAIEEDAVCQALR